MASVHVQYDSGPDSDSEVEDDDYLGTSGDTDGANLASQDEAVGQAMGESLESESETKDTENTSTTEENTKSGIADVMAKILGKTIPKNKNPVLAKGQTDREIQRRKRVRDKETGKVGKKSKKSKDGDESSDWTDASDDDSPESQKKAQLKMQKRKEWEEMGRMKPSVLDKDKERQLQKIATRGVVQLFNAVRQQQNILGDRLSEAGTSERRRDKARGSLNKKSFLDLLDSTKSASALASRKDKRQLQDESNKSETWSILRDDFMMGAKMKDWNKDSDGSGDDSAIGVDHDNLM